MSAALISAARLLAPAELYCFPLRGKLPAVSYAEGGRGWKDATRDTEQIERWAAEYPDANVGVQPGMSGLVVVDLDETKPVDKVPALIRLYAEVEARGGLPETLTVRTGSGGRHLYFRAHPDTVLGQRNGVLNPDTGMVESGVDYRGTKGYVVAPPSVHPGTGKPYAWLTRSGDYEPDLVLPIPDWLVRWLDPPRVARAVPADWRPTVGAGEGTAEQRRVAGMLRAACDRIAALGQGMSRRTEMQRTAYQFGGWLWTGFSQSDLRAALQQAAVACGHWDRDTERTIDDAIRDGIAKPYPLPPNSMGWNEAPVVARGRRRAAPQGDGVGGTEGAGDGEDTSEESRTVDDIDGDDGAPETSVWDQLSRTKGTEDSPGRPRPTLRNVVVVLEQDSRWRGRVRVDLLCDHIVIDGRPITDADEVRITCWLDRVYALETSPERVHSAVVAIGERDAYSPVVEYLEGLTWDNKARLDTWLETYAGVEPNEDGLNAAYGAKWMISAVARAYVPGCQADSVLIFSGPKGLGKTSTLRTLAGENWYSESPLPIGTDEAPKKLAGVWVYELGELASLKRAAIEGVKQFITTKTDRFRPSYGRNQVVRQRQCVFAGTTNERAFLVEDDRRWWVRKVTKAADLVALARDRDQLWAEAVHRWRRAERWHLDEDQSKKHAADVDQYVHVDPWEPTIADWAKGRGDFTTADVLTGPLKRDIGEISKADEMRVGSILTQIGRVRTRTTIGGRRAYVWRT